MRTMSKIAAFFMLLAGLTASRPALGQGIPGPDDQSPIWSPDGTQIAFTSLRGGNWDVYVIDANGENLRNVSGLSTDEYTPRWSPDGRQLAFGVHYAGGSSDIYVVDADGENLRNLTTSPERERLVGWSPDGRYILYMITRQGQEDLYVMEADGSHPVNLSNRLVDYPGGGWSPDGQWIAFYGANSARTLAHLYVLDAEGKNRRDVLSGYWFSTQECCLFQWTWSPDSQFIAFMMPDDGSLYTVNVESGAIRPLAYLAGAVRALDWTSSGQEIVVSLGDPPSSNQPPREKGRIGVYVVDVTSGGVRRISDRINSWFALSTDGRWIFPLLPFGAPTVDFVAVDGTASRSFDVSYYNTFGLDWSPDGTQLAIGLCIDDDADLFVFNLVTGEVLNLTPDDAFSTGVEPIMTMCGAYG